MNILKLNILKLNILFAILVGALVFLQTKALSKDAKSVGETPDFLVHDGKDPSLWIKKYSDKIKISPEDFVSYYHRGRCYMDMKENAKAIDDFNTSIRLNPRNKPAKHPISEFDDARTYLSFCYQHLALIYLEQNKFQKAAEDATTAINLRPDYAMNWQTRGSAYIKLGKKDLAQKDFQKAFNLHHSPVEGY
jgi:tetratricopeptide (TPR) repeat protein